MQREGKGTGFIGRTTKSIRLAIRLVLVIMLAASPAFAGHPLVTDDTGTQGKAMSIF